MTEVSVPGAQTRAAPRAWTGQRRGGAGNRVFLALTGSRLGRALAPGLLVFVVAYFLVVDRKGRSASFDLARRVGRGNSWSRRVRFAYGHMFEFGSMLFERVVLAHAGSHLFTIERRGEDAIRAAASRGRGVVLVSAHMGNWAAMAFGLAELGLAVTVVMYGEEARRALAAEDADLSGVRIVASDGGPAAATATMAALRRGEIVAMMGDRVLGGRGVELPFLGGRAEFPVGPYVLAAACEAPIFSAFAVRRGWYRYLFQAHELGVCRYTSRRTRTQDLARWAAAFAEQLEGLVRAQPEQWGNLFPFWKEPGDAAPPSER